MELAALRAVCGYKHGAPLELFILGTRSTEKSEVRLSEDFAPGSDARAPQIGLAVNNTVACGVETAGDYEKEGVSRRSKSRRRGVFAQRRVR
jgi:hypothetical protein